jgi:putative transposase
LSILKRCILSAYIHNNPKDIEGYNGKKHLYRYSSYGIYLGLRKDPYNLIDTSFILEQFSSDPQKAMEKYQQFTTTMRDTGICNKVDEDIMAAYTKNEYRSEKKSIARDVQPDTLVSSILEVMEVETQESLKNKYSRKSSKLRAFVVYAMRVLCGYNFRQICEYIGNITMSGITRLSMKGFQLTAVDERYRLAFEAVLNMP